ncbi:MAG: lysophospholipid acyltransferase family protein [Candidatus Omnitrophica bacterium]|nr:lysophospholipid acyltransferase family protein [Candidatus Omnitrophota bacterium]
MAKFKPRRVVIFWLFRCASFFIFILPISLGLRFGQLLGKAAFCLLKGPRKTALDNLDIAFSSSKSAKEKEHIVREVFENLGKNLVEVVSLVKFNKRNIDRYIACRGFETIERLLEQGKGGIVLSAHFGNWELMAHYFGIKGYKVNVIARRMRMDHFENILARVRRRHGVNVIHRDASTKEVLVIIKRNEFIAMMPDQDMDSVSGVFVDFFGRKAYTPNGPAVLNFLTKLPIVTCFMVRKAFGHEILVGRQMELASTGDRAKDILENTQRYTRIIEDHVRRFPTQWVWFHDRWKTQPESRNQRGT